MQQRQQWQAGDDFCLAEGTSPCSAQPPALVSFTSFAGGGLPARSPPGAKTLLLLQEQCQSPACETAAGTRLSGEQGRGWV